MEGRTKLAKLDFLLRYPRYLKRALEIRNASQRAIDRISDAPDIESRMVRYRFGPWDPAYFVLLGRLIGKGLILPVPYKHGIGYRSTEKGHALSSNLREVETWEPIGTRADTLRTKFDLSGTYLKDFVYEHFPEVAGADWGTQL